ncbi:hypothetical protein FEE95_21290 [Maribacter algarum]|uniref:Uncharacterized protein n=1 Tax=Maribacter algarum (ex Zhang et al. 2020) TaxID=2578118 RepID=A0A5S3PJD6_9FLAO|nr:hypothetical protein [Maribacter algarum]TMM52224.1 hypothetical protein FEE95_21290 [Maribacter algarum]
MKTRITLLIAFISLSFTACVKDYIGHGPDGKEVQLTSDNYLDVAVLQKLSLNDDILVIDAEIDKLNLISPNDPGYNEAQAQIAALSKKRDGLKLQIGSINDISIVGDFPIPCDTPNGKCIPVRLEFFAFNQNIARAAVLYRDDNGNKKGASDKLVDLPGFEGKVQYIRVPVTDFDNQITLEIVQRDFDGNTSRFEITLDR